MNKILLVFIVIGVITYLNKLKWRPYAYIRPFKDIRVGDRVVFTSDWADELTNNWNKKGKYAGWNVDEEYVVLSISENNGLFFATIYNPLNQKQSEINTGWLETKEV